MRCEGSARGGPPELGTIVKRFNMVIPFLWWLLGITRRSKRMLSLHDRKIKSIFYDRKTIEAGLSNKAETPFRRYHLAALG